MKDKTQTSNKKFPVLAVLLIVLACGVFAYSAYRLIDFYREDAQVEEQMHELYELAVTTVPPDAPAQTLAPELTEAPSATAYLPNQTYAPTQKPGVSELPAATDTPAPANTAAAATQYNTAPANTQQPQATQDASQATPESTQAPYTPPTAGPLYVDFSVLQQINPDICGWLYSPGTVINYPVLYSSDNVYYLNHLYDGTQSAAGSLFVDYRNSRDFTDLNTIIFGHHMKSGTMFGSLKYYKSAYYYNSHPYMWLYTPEAVYRLDVIAAYTTRAGGEPYSMYYDSASLASYITTAMQNSAFTTSADVSSAKRVITLSTCAYDFTNARFVVVCSPVRVG